MAYGGTKTTYNVGERIIFAPSSVAEKASNTMGKEMTKEEINYIIEAFAKSAQRAKESGFDGIEIHAAHTYLINQFLSPYYNRRTDEYGGNLENRMRFLKEIYFAMREKVGDDYPIIVKLTATEFFEGGQSFEDTRVICKELERIGVDAIDLSGNIHGKAKGMVGQEFDGYKIENEGYFYQYGSVISEEINIPVMTVGGLSDISKIDEILKNTNIEYFAVSRPLLAEPNLIKRWKDGDTTKAKCIRCSKCRTATGNYCVIFNR
ncbi:NADH oxidase [bioreactor metagenome]|uniref:NADH oxidase n=1 Tax=bioreactor metagenome TaxID=1076179 RepID=A0A644ZD72_9ZZZZ